MIRFECDYTEGAHPLIIQRLADTNFFQTKGYGEDEFCERARECIKKVCGTENADVHFLVGGTQTNLIMISSALKSYQGVLSAPTGHINVHETGAIEATGHKVLVISNDAETIRKTGGKINAEDIESYCLKHYNDDSREHIVQPGMVYISQPTENGTVYSKDEILEINKVCKKHGLFFYIDGARLGYAVCSGNDAPDLEFIAHNCDCFYIGGTKVGALFGEALVITNDRLKRDFRYVIKQRGALLAKGRLLGIQFETLFKDNLYFEISKRAVDLAIKIKEAFLQNGYQMFYDSYTNQQFPIIPNSKLEKFAEKYTFSHWEDVSSDKTAVRFCTSWATKDEDVSELVNDIDHF